MKKRFTIRSLYTGDLLCQPQTTVAECYGQLHKAGFPADHAVELLRDGQPMAQAARRPTGKARGSKQQRASQLFS